jgi:hypothetical protein
MAKKPYVDCCKAGCQYQPYPALCKDCKWDINGKGKWDLFTPEKVKKLERG